MTTQSVWLLKCSFMQKKLPFFSENKKVCALAHTRAERGCRQATSTFRASAHPQRSVLFHSIGNEISYRMKKKPDGLLFHNRTSSAAICAASAQIAFRHLRNRIRDFSLPRRSKAKLYYAPEWRMKWIFGHFFN